MSSFGKNTWEVIKGMPPWAKGVLVVGTATGLYFLFDSIYKRVRDNAKQAAADAANQTAVTAAGNTLQQLAQQGINPSYPDAQYDSLASELFSCFDGWGTCAEVTDYFTQNVQNEADIYKLIQAYGIRTASSGKFNPTPDFRGNLPGEVNDECNSSQISTINDDFAKKGITFRF